MVDTILPYKQVALQVIHCGHNVRLPEATAGAAIRCSFFFENFAGALPCHLR
jgi:hypothetical protein